MPPLYLRCDQHLLQLPDGLQLGNHIRFFKFVFFFDDCILNNDLLDDHFGSNKFRIVLHDRNQQQHGIK